MNLSRLAWLVGLSLLVMVVNVAVSVLYMVVYSYLINPGHEKQYYDDHIQIAAPYCSIVAGIPLMFLAGWWISGWWEGEHAIRSAVIVWLAYAVIDVAIMVAAGATSQIGLLVAISLITKLAAIYFGAVVGSRSV
jgi:hypothetical protein